MDAGISAADAGALLTDALATTTKACLFGTGEPVVVVAAGKAAAAMATAFLRAGPVSVFAGLVASTGTAAVPPPFHVIHAGHPVPDGRSEEAGRRALALASAGRHPLVLLLSGGASALVAVPADGLTLDDKRRATARLLHAGADIHSLNTVRKHLSAIKGGRLAAAARGPVLAFAVSDVVGNDPSVIASGPTVPDPTSFQDALTVLDRFGGRPTYPPAVVRLLEDGAAGLHEETPKPGDPRLSSAITRVIGSRLDALNGAARAAAAAGYEPVIIDAPVVGEAREVAPAHVATMLELASRVRGPAAILSAGETTVRVVGTGLGGRNQEFALAAAATLHRSHGRAILASLGTDGIDGPTDAAGAMADTTTSDRLRRAGITASRVLDDNDSYRVFEALGDLVTTGPTNTNVGDMQVLLVV